VCVCVSLCSVCVCVCVCVCVLESEKCEGNMFQGRPLYLCEVLMRLVFETSVVGVKSNLLIIIVDCQIHVATVQVGVINLHAANITRI
jgi:hypothetical protein